MPAGASTDRTPTHNRSHPWPRTGLHCAGEIHGDVGRAAMRGAASKRHKCDGDCPQPTNIWPPRRHTESARGTGARTLSRHRGASPPGGAAQWGDVTLPAGEHDPCQHEQATPPTYRPAPQSSPAHPFATGAAQPKQPKLTTSLSTTKAAATPATTSSQHANPATADAAPATTT